MNDAERQTHIVAVLVEAFAELIERDPRAFRGKFRKMAADPFAFYRGSALLFYADVDRREDPWVDERDVAGVDPGRPARGELRHLHGLAGVLVFDVNDFDEAYLGHFTWDLQRMAAQLALLGLRARRSPTTTIARARSRPTLHAYVDQVRHVRRVRATTRLRARARQHRRGRPRRAPAGAAARPALDLLERLTVVDGTSGGFADGPGSAGSTTTERERGAGGVRALPRDDPATQAPARASPTTSRTSSARTGFGIGCGGLPRLQRCWSRATTRRWRTTSCCP